jgi:hypothetical protein
MEKAEQLHLEKLKAEVELTKANVAQIKAYTRKLNAEASRIEQGKK